MRDMTRVGTEPTGTLNINQMSDMPIEHTLAIKYILSVPMA